MLSHQFYNETVLNKMALFTDPLDMSCWPFLSPLSFIRLSCVTIFLSHCGLAGLRRARLNVSPSLGALQI